MAPDLIRLQSYRSVYGYVSQFVKNDFLRRCFSFHPLLIGGNPFDAASLYVLIHYLEREWGVHYAMGGTGSIVNGMGRLFAELGGRVYLNAAVDEILVDGAKVIGVRLADGSLHKADLVISNADVAWTYSQLDPGSISQEKYGSPDQKVEVQHVALRDLFRHKTSVYRHRIGPSQYHPERALPRAFTRHIQRTKSAGRFFTLSAHAHHHRSVAGAGGP